MSQELSFIEFKGQSYHDRCSDCNLPIENSAVVLLSTMLIFCDESCLMNFIGTRTADITIREEGHPHCMLS